MEARTAGLCRGGSSLRHTVPSVALPLLRIAYPTWLSSWWNMDGAISSIERLPPPQNSAKSATGESSGGLRQDADSVPEDWIVRPHGK